MSRMASVREVNTCYARMNIGHLMVSVDLLPCDVNHGRVPQDVAYLGTFRMAMIQNVCILLAVVELENQHGQLILNDGINQQIGANAEEEEPLEIQGDSGVAFRFVDEPAHVDGSHVVPAEELSDAESSVNQPVPAAPAAHDLVVFPQETLP